MASARKHLTYANVLATVAAFLALGGGGLAVASHLTVRGSDIVRDAVRSKHIKAASVKGRQIAPNAVTGSKVNESTLGTVPNADRVDGSHASAFLRSNAPGVPVAGANVSAGGVLQEWFNRLGGMPTVTVQGTGQYLLTFPGFQAQVSNSIALVSLQSGTSGEISRSSGGGDNPAVRTFDSEGTATNKGFDLLIVVPSS